MGWQRKLTSDLAIEALHDGTRSDQIWREYGYNELNIVENGLLDEFRLALGLPFERLALIDRC